MEKVEQYVAEVDSFIAKYPTITQYGRLSIELIG
jgi:hypothetical protein